MSRKTEPRVGSGQVGPASPTAGPPWGGQAWQPLQTPCCAQDHSGAGSGSGRTSPAPRDPMRQGDQCHHTQLKVICSHWAGGVSTATHLPPSPCVSCRYCHRAPLERQQRPPQPGGPPPEGEPGTLRGVPRVHGGDHVADAPADHRQWCGRPSTGPVAAPAAGTCAPGEVRATAQATPTAPRATHCPWKLAPRK